MDRLVAVRDVGQAEDSASVYGSRSFINSDRAVTYLRDTHGWKIAHHADGPLLELCHDMVAVSIQATHEVSARVVQLLRRRGMYGPVLAIGSDMRNLVVLADANGLIRSDVRVVRGVDVLGCPKMVPLPGSVVTPVRWIIPPTPTRRWLPTLAAVLGAIESAFDS